MSPTRVRCPTCHREASWDQPYRPFCSERCRLIDLGAWFSEQRSIPGESAGPANEQPPPADDEERPVKN